MNPLTLIGRLLVGSFLFHVTLCPSAAESTQNVSFKRVLRWLSTSTHFRQGLRGQVRTQDLAYFGVMVLVFLSLARAAAESLRWR